MENLKIQIKIKEAILEERSKNLDEKLQKVLGVSEDEFIFEDLVKTYNELLDEGYTIEEIDLSSLGNSNLFNLGKGGLMSWIKESLIKWFLEQVFPGSPKTVAMASQVLADVNPLHLLSIFNPNKPEKCIEHFPSVADSLIEVFLRNTLVSSTETNKMGNLLGNVFGQAIQDSNIGEIAADKFCKQLKEL